MTDLFTPLYQIFLQLFGGGTNTFASGISTILAMFAVIFVILVPFIIVYRVMKILTR